MGGDEDNERDGSSDAMGSAAFYRAPPKIPRPPRHPLYLRALHGPRPRGAGADARQESPHRVASRPIENRASVGVVATMRHRRVEAAVSARRTVAAAK